MRTQLAETYRRLGRHARGRRPLAYQRLRGALEQLIEQGAVAPGEPLPSERELAQTLALSRVTVRRALGGLIERGLLEPRHGAGTFVAERIVKSVSALGSFSDDLRARGLEPRSKYLARALGRVTPEEAMALGLSPGAGVVRLHRVRYAGATALADERSVVPQSVLADPALVRGSLYEALERAGGRPVRALQRLRAVALEADAAQRLGLPAGSPALAIERRAFAADGRAVELTRSLYRGDAYDFVAELRRK